MRKGAALFAVIPAILLLSACGYGGGSTSLYGSGLYGSGSSSPSPSTSPSASPSTSPSKPQADPNAPRGQCATSALEVTVENTQGAAGSLYSNIVFRNTGSMPCALSGIPGVSVVGNGDGTQLGAPAMQEGSAEPVVQLAPNGKAIAILQSTNIGTNGGPLAGQCTVRGGDGYRIYPPHSFTAVFVAAAVPACSNGTVWMYVNAVMPG